MADLNTLTTSLASMKQTMVNRLISLGDTNISTNNSMQTIVNHYNDVRFTVVPTSSCDLVAMTPMFYMYDAYDATAIGSAKTILTANNSSVQANYTDIIASEAEVINTWQGYLRMNSFTSLTSMQFPKVKYIIGSNSFIQPNSSYINTTLSGIFEFPNLKANLSTNNYICACLSNITKFSAPEYEWAMGNSTVTYYNQNLTYVNLEKYKGYYDYSTNTFKISTNIIGQNCPNIECLILGDTDAITTNLMYTSTTYSNFTTLVLNVTKVPTLSSSSYIKQSDSYYPKFNIETGSIYVPDALLTEFQEATYWSTYYDMFKPLSTFVNTWENS